MAKLFDGETKIDIPDSKFPDDSSHFASDFLSDVSVAKCAIEIRLGFLRKVYGILSAQLLTTVAICGFFISSESIKSYVQQSQWMLFVSMIGTFVLIFALHVKQRDVPTNYILLALFTLMESYMIGVITTMYDKVVVLEAFALTLIVTVSLTIYTLQSSRDFSAWGASLFAALLVLIFAGFFQMLFPAPWLEFALAAGGALIFSMFIVYDTHMIMHRLSAEEYIPAAISLYLDILNLFLHLLRLISELNKNN